MYEKGSEWRRWDLHVHTPSTILNNQFGSWDEYLAAIEAQDAVRVIGVTDYLTIRGYSEMKAHKQAGRLPKIDLLLPNIEFRIAPPTDKATAINIHLLVSPNDPQHETKTLQALGRLHWRYDDNNYSCLPDQLIALGRAFDKNAKDDNAALRVGATQFKPDFTVLREWFENEKWLRANSLVAVSAGADGLSGFRRDGAWAALRDEITRFSHILFSGRPGERTFWLGEGTDEERETMRRLHGPKPCVHGSDAHSVAKLFKPDEDRFCWIKADPTFEGLKQILYEPKDRVYINATPPIYHDNARVIAKVTLADSGGWFENTTIELNAGLVSIIGQKGSGKSALAELIAYAAGSWPRDEPDGFLKRVTTANLDGLLVRLYWANGATSTVRLWDDQSGLDEVRYLSQKFVERLCAQDGISSELVREIENVIFSYLDPTDTLNASDFDELRAIKTDGIRLEGERLRAEIDRVILEECALHASIAKLPEKNTRIKTLTTEREGLTRQIPPPASAEEAKTQRDLQEKRDLLAKLNQASAADKQLLQKIDDIRTRIAAFGAQMQRFYADVEPMLQSVGLKQPALKNFLPVFSGDVKTPLDASAAEIGERITKRNGADPPADGTIKHVQSQIDLLANKEAADKAKQARVRLIQIRVAAINAEIDRLNAEINHVQEVDKKRLETAKAQRLDAYIAYFQNLKGEQAALGGLYEPIRTKLNEEALLEDNPLEFSIRWEVNLKIWLDRGGSLFDQRRPLPYGTFDNLGEAARQILVPGWSSGDPAKIGAAFEDFIAKFRDDKLPWRSYARAGVKLEDILRWLYEVDHIRLTYGLKFNGTDLEALSPGTKGIVLLILYLGMDIGDSRPLVVDQPDENLDNESIYNLLRPYFRRAKQRRQIIVITHNPNLVVNADSEQVIVASLTRRANGLPHIIYKSGSLENSAPPDERIRGAVCRILEGGTDAFLKREQRYALPAH
jgi:energy-coupling factor transporter ATP-binding protein EcfA2